MPRAQRIPPLRPLNRQPVASTITNLLIQSLLSKQLRPGDKLPTESELAQTLKVGRNSVREAIKMLSSLGVIEIRRGVGTFIPASLNASVLHPLIMSLVYRLGTSVELWELRVLVDAGVVDLAIQKASPEDILALEQANERIRHALDSDPLAIGPVRDLDMAFHRRLLYATKNPLVAELGQAIYTLFFASIEMSLAGDPASAYQNHQLIIDAIKNKRSDEARHLVTRSLSHWIAILNESAAMGVERDGDQDRGPEPKDESSTVP
jgi:GntR family transcriptional repressor for pyruvate dehydrogenase complex